MLETKVKRAELELRATKEEAELAADDYECEINDLTQKAGLAAGLQEELTALQRKLELSPSPTRADPLQAGYSDKLIKDLETKLSKAERRADEMEAAQSDQLQRGYSDRLMKDLESKLRETQRRADEMEAARDEREQDLAEYRITVEQERANWQERMTRLERDGRELLNATTAAVDAGEESDQANESLIAENVKLKAETIELREATTQSPYASRIP